jgi:hypothetical protein
LCGWNLAYLFLPASFKNKCAKLAIAVLAASEGAEKSVGKQKNKH